MSSKPNLDQNSRETSHRKSLKLVLKNSNNILDFFNCTKEEIFFLQNSLINSMEIEVKTNARNLEIIELVNNLKTEVFFYLTSERLHDKIY